MIDFNKYSNYREIPVNRQVETLCEKIRETGIDLTDSYEKWRNVGFALASEFADSGLSFFIRLSSNYPRFSEDECRKMYASIITSTPPANPITIKTLFSYAMQKGIIIHPTEPGSDNGNTCQTLEPRQLSDEERQQIIDDEEHSLKTIPQSVKAALPSFLRRTIEHTDFEPEQDMILLGAMSALSSCMNNVFAYYDGARLYPNLFSFVVGAPSSGKGRVGICKQLIEPIHKELKEAYEAQKAKYDAEKLAYNTERRANPDAIPPVEPPQKMKLLPANSTMTAVVEALSNNPDGLSIIVTEGDVLFNAFKNDVSNYDVILRMAYHNEHISYLRRTNKEWVECDSPMLSMLVASYPEQVSKICPSTSDGLFSRFMFYNLPDCLIWRDNFSKPGKPKENLDLSRKFLKLGEQYHSFYRTLLGKNSPGTRCYVFELTDDQQKRFNDFFQTLLDRYYAVFGNPVIGTIHRLGVNFIRIAEIISVLRCMDEDLPVQHCSDFIGDEDVAYSLICSDQDFNSVMEIIRVIASHDAKVLVSILNDQKAEMLKQLTAKQLDTYTQLPKEFTSDEFEKIAKDFKVTARAISNRVIRIVERGLIKFSNNKYHKVI